MLSVSYKEKLSKLKGVAGKPFSQGLQASELESFLEKDGRLQQAIELAETRMDQLRNECPDLVCLDEKSLISKLQNGILNFYPPDNVSPYVPLAAKGPWIVTITGSVIFDTGGYGMLGLGHDPDVVRQAMAEPYVMANVMTPSLSQYKFIHALKSRIGSSRAECPFSSFVCINSGSEAMTVATRLSDIRAKVMTDPGGKHQGKKISFLAFRGGFHGRTGRPAQASDSSRKKYEVLASFRGTDNLITVTPNNLSELRAAFENANKQGIFIEAMLMEPVMGEGNPGQAITPEFYAEARKLTTEHGSFLIVDSIQAGLRAHGVLSIVDYPGFENLDAPDMESYSKALNAGQFPLSVLALSAEAAQTYKTGVYGNTMTTNPRALEVACAVLGQVDQGLKKNIVERGKEFILKLEKLKAEIPGAIIKVQGTGLLVSAELADGLNVVGESGIEQWMRKDGVNVIHGGKNSLRFTPYFGITSDEIDLVIRSVKRAIQAHL